MWKEGMPKAKQQDWRQADVSLLFNQLVEDEVDDVWPPPPTVQK